MIFSKTQQLLNDRTRILTCLVTSTTVLIQCRSCLDLRDQALPTVVTLKEVVIIYTFVTTSMAAIKALDTFHIQNCFLLFKYYKTKLRLQSHIFTTPQVLSSPELFHADKYINTFNSHYLFKLQAVKIMIQTFSLNLSGTSTHRPQADLEQFFCFQINLISESKLIACDT